MLIRRGSGRESMSAVATLLSNNLKQKRSPTFRAQLHRLPAHDLVWAAIESEAGSAPPPSSSVSDQSRLDPQKCLTSS